MRTITLISIFALSACAGVTPNPEMNALKSEIKELKGRMAQSNSRITGSVMELKVQEEWNKEIVNWIKFQLKKDEKIEIKLFELEAAYEQVQHDIRELQKKLEALKTRKKR